MHILTSQLNKTFKTLFILNFLSVIISMVCLYFSIGIISINIMMFLFGTNIFMCCYFALKYENYNLIDYYCNNDLIICFNSDLIIIIIKILYSTIFITNIIILLCVIYLYNV